MLHLARSRYGTGYMRGVFIALGILMIVIGISAYASSTSDRVALTVLSLVLAAAAFVSAVFVKETRSEVLTATTRKNPVTPRGKRAPPVLSPDGRVSTS